jgi:hypothetical protein
MQATDRMTKIVNGLTVVGLMLPSYSYFGLLVDTLHARSDSHGRVFGPRARVAVGWLTIFWVLAAAIMAAFRRQSTSQRFRVVLALNALIAGLLVVQMWLN